MQVASVSAINGAAASASAAPNHASASVETAGHVSTVTATPSPIIPSSIAPVITNGLHSVTVNDQIDLDHQVIYQSSTPTPLPAVYSTASPVIPSSVTPVVTNGVQQDVAVKGLLGNTEYIHLGPQFTPTPSPLPVIPSTAAPIIPSSVIPDVTNRIHQGISVNGFVENNDRIDLGPQLIHDQIAIDNRQLRLNPALIPSANIIPPEISVTPKAAVPRLRPTPGTLLTTPGLGTVASSPNILREEGSAGINVNTVNTGLGPVAYSPNVLRGEEGVGININTVNTGLGNAAYSPNVLKEGPVGINTLQYAQQRQISPQQLYSLQNQRNLLNNQIQYSPQQSSTGPALFTPTEEPIEDRPGQDPNVAIGGARITPLPNYQQQGIISSELAKSGIDASQLQLTNVPLSDVSNLPGNVNLQGAVVNNGPRAQGLGRYGREVEKEKKNN